MAYETVTKKSLGARLGDSLKGIITGLILVALGIGLLFWNEGNFIKTKKGLEEGAASVVSIQPDAVSAENNGKLVHLSGPTSTTETLTDTQLGLRVTDSVRLDRKVEMFQWTERSQEEKREKTGGGIEIKTTYTYAKVWSPEVIDSSQFKDPQYVGANPTTMLFESRSWTAGMVTLGAFRLNPAQISRIRGEEPVPVGQQQLDALPEELRTHAHISQPFLYFGANPQSPQIGDQRISFSRVPVTEITIVARQNGNTFEPHTTSQGTKIDLFAMGALSAGQMFQEAEELNVTTTWILRLVGFVLILIGFNMVFAPLGVLASVLPPAGAIVRFGTGLLSFVLTLPVSLITIAVGWLAFRPVIGGAILAAAVLLPLVAIFLFKKKKPLANANLA
jgi:hypothetical protein